MKKYCMFLATLAVLSACKKEEVPAEPVAVEEVPAETPITTECFEGVTKNDTIRLMVRMKGAAFVDGALSYHFFEKDNSDGTLAGEMRGDTLFAHYTFKSEGRISIREVVFLKNKNIFSEGYGDLLESKLPADTVKFKDRKKLYFDSKITLAKIDCGV